MDTKQTSRSRKWIILKGLGLALITNAAFCVLNSRRTPKSTFCKNDETPPILDSDFSTSSSPKTARLTSNKLCSPNSSEKLWRRLRWMNVTQLSSFRASSRITSSIPLSVGSITVLKVRWQDSTHRLESQYSIRLAVSLATAGWPSSAHNTV